MDGIVPALFLLILLGLFIGAAMSIVLAYMLIYHKSRSMIISKNFLNATIINFSIVGIAAFFTLIGANTVIGYSPLKYISPIMLVISISILIAGKSVAKSNNKINQDMT